MTGRRERARERTIDEIVDAAEALVLAADPGGFTVADIAAGLGMTAGALYRYFPGRQAILARVQARCLRSLARALAAAASDRPVASLLAQCGALVAWAGREPARYELLARMLAEPRPLVDGDALEDVVPAAREALAPAVGAWAAAGLVGEPLAGALGLFSTVHGALQVGKLARFVPAVAGPAAARRQVEAVLVGSGADPGEVGAAPPWEGA